MLRRSLASLNIADGVDRRIVHLHSLSRELEVARFG
jgi:hypothetical protein